MEAFAAMPSPWETPPRLRSIVSAMGERKGGKTGQKRLHNVILCEQIDGQKGMGYLFDGKIGKESLYSV